MGTSRGSSPKQKQGGGVPHCGLAIYNFLNYLKANEEL